VPWWRPFTKPRSDYEIAERVAAEVAAGRIAPTLAPMFEKALRDEQAGKAIVMRDPGVRPRPPKRPSWG
jgi:hypothetical protein